MPLKTKLSSPLQLLSLRGRFYTMRLWFLIVLVLFLQETFSTNSVLLTAHHLHYSMWLIHALFIVATSCNIWVGYALGTWFKRTFDQGKTVRFAKKFSTRLENILGKSGQRFFLTLLGFINFTYVNAFVFAWSNVSFVNIFIFTLLGDTLWYLLAWSAVLGAESLFSNQLFVVPAILLFSTLIMLLSGRLSKKYMVN